MYDLTDYTWVLPFIPLASKIYQEWKKIKDKIEAYLHLIGPMKPRLCGDASDHPCSPGTHFHNVNNLRLDTIPVKILLGSPINPAFNKVPNKIGFGSEYAEPFAKWLFNYYRNKNKSGKPTFPIELDPSTLAHERLEYKTEMGIVTEPNLGFKSDNLGGFYKDVNDLKPKNSHLLIAKLPFPNESPYQKQSHPHGIVICGSDYHGTEAFKEAMWKWSVDIYKEVGDSSFFALFNINSLRLDRKEILRADPNAIPEPIILKIRRNSENRFIEIN